MRFSSGIWRFTTELKVLPFDNVKGSRTLVNFLFFKKIEDWPVFEVFLPIWYTERKSERGGGFEDF